MSSKKRRRRKRQPKNGRLLDELIAGNVYSAVRDESHTLISRLVDEGLKDPKLREKIHDLTRTILKHLAEHV